MPPERTIRNKPFKPHVRTTTAAAREASTNAAAASSSSSSSRTGAVPRPRGRPPKHAPSRRTSVPASSPDQALDVDEDEDDGDIVLEDARASDDDEDDDNDEIPSSPDGIAKRVTATVDSDSSLESDAFEAIKPKAKSSSKSKGKGQETGRTPDSKNKDKKASSRNDSEGKGPRQRIPAELLRTLIQHHFRDKEMRVNAEASLLVGKYMETFVCEAIARAVYERAEAKGKAGDRGPGDAGAKKGADDFVEVEDLEKLAPQLLLDF